MHWYNLPVCQYCCNGLHASETTADRTWVSRWCSFIR